MKNWRDACVLPHAPLREALQRIETSSLQIALVLDSAGRLLGLITDGDVRRALLRGIGLAAPVALLMNQHPTTAPASMSRDALFALMRKNNLRHIPVLDDSGVLLRLETLDDLIAQRSRPNWVVLMAGGLGQRLRPLTEDCPKPLLPVGGRPLLETILESFVTQGFERFFLSVNYKAEMIRAHFGNGRKWGVEIEYLEEKDKLGTAGALSLLPEKPTDPMVVMNGDLLTAMDFTRLLDFHSEHDAAATMGVREYSVQVPYGVVEVSNNYTVSMIEKPTHSWFINAGVYAIGPAALDRLRPGEPVDMPSLFQRIIDDQGKVAAYPVREYWLDIGRMEDLQRANLEFSMVFNRQQGDSL